ncbi:hypothetical protein EDD86DRAFT_213564, partial [Gorgonomyces haynaldii]
MEAEFIEHVQHSRQSTVDVEDDDLVPLVIRLIMAILVPMWLAMVLSSLFFVTLRQMIATPDENGRFISRDLNIQITPFDNTTQLSTFLAVPALFGPVLSQPLITPVVWINDTGCHQISRDKPALTEQQQQMIQRNTHPLFSDAPVRWTALVMRGGCEFNQKVFRMEQAGFSQTIVYNYESSKDIPVRMSSRIQGPFLETPAMFTTHKAGQQLADALVKHQVLILHMKPTHWGFMVDSNAFKDICIRTLIRTLYTTIPLLMMLCFGLVATLVRNRIVYNSWQLRETLEFILFEQPPKAPKLDQMIFPEYVIQSSDLKGEQSWAQGGHLISQGCAICLDEFVEGQRSRQLPCRHVFHCECVDPWLLGHQRLCPICKRDVTEH